MKITIEKKICRVFGQLSEDSPQQFIEVPGFVFDFRGHELMCVSAGHVGWFMIALGSTGCGILPPAETDPTSLIFAVMAAPADMLDSLEKSIKEIKAGNFARTGPFNVKKAVEQRDGFIQSN